MWLVGVVESMGVTVTNGCGRKEVYRFHHTTYPYSSCICYFLQQHPYFLLIKKMFSFFFRYFYVMMIIIIVMSNKYTINNK